MSFIILKEFFPFKKHSILFCKNLKIKVTNYNNKIEKRKKLKATILPIIFFLFLAKATIVVYLYI